MTEISDNKKTIEKQPTAGSIFLKATLLSLLFVLIMLFITALGVVGFGYSKLNSFAKKADTSIGELRTLVSTGLEKTPDQTDNYKTILLLGLDSVANKPGSPQLTDTMLLISINMTNGKVNTLSLPRDLWSTAYITRINALYEYGKDKYPNRPEQFPEEVIEKLTGIDINHTLTLSLENVAEVIDIIGGIEVEVLEGFVDDQFPRDDVDIFKASQDELYETVSFNDGLQHMDGQTTLKYIRSRKSSNLEQGTDVARSIRQQQVISELVSKIVNFSIIKDTNKLAELYLLYGNEFENQFSKIEAISTLNYLLPYKDNLKINSHTLSIYPDDQNGVITNPPLYKYNSQWVYEIIDNQRFESEVKQLLQEK